MTKREKRFWKNKIKQKPDYFKENHNPKLYLNVILPDLTDEELEYLSSRIVNVEELNLTDTRITDYGISFLTELPKLNYLRLKDTDITRKCIPELLKIKSLNHLHLGSIEATCEDLIPLAAHENLKELIARPSDFNKEVILEMKRLRPDLEVIIKGSYHLYNFSTNSRSQTF